MTMAGRFLITTSRSAALVLALLVWPGRAFAAPAVWTPDGVAACAAAAVQESPSLASLGADGVVLVWADRRSGEYDIYAQRLDASGTAQWAANGVKVCDAEYDQQFPLAIADGSGGVIVAWQDGRLGDDGMEIYAQRLGADGSAAWTVNGVPVCTHAPDLGDPPTAFSHVICSDGAGGAIIAWRDTRSDPVQANTEIYAQRLDASGAPLWAANGLQVLGFTTAKWATRNPIIAADCASGAVVVWQDGRNSVSTANDLYAQRITAGGSAAWTPNGVALCNAAGEQGYPDITAAEGGVVVAWEDKRCGAYDIYAQRLGLAGDALWGANGRAVCTNSGEQRTPRVVSNGAGGFFLAWSDSRLSAPQTDIFAQTLTGEGAAVWAAQGVAACQAAGSQTRIRMAASLPGSVVLTWMDTRNETTAGLYDIYGQRVDAAGLPVWEPGGVAVANRPGTNQRLQQTATDGLCGVYTTWEDDRNAGDWDVYAHRLSPWTVVVDVAQARLQPAGQPLLIPSAVVSAALDGCFYVQDSGRSCGLKVVSDHAVTPGDLVMVGGTVGQECAPYLNAPAVSKLGSAMAPRALGVSGRALGGEGVSNSYGLTTSGVLVRIWGRVLSRQEGPPRSLIISDGSVDVRVFTQSEASVGDYVAATGVSSCQPGQNGPEPVLLTTDSSDVQVLASP